MSAEKREFDVLRGNMNVDMSLTNKGYQFVFRSNIEYEMEAL